MLWKRGWLLNSLRYRVEKDIRETLYQNEAFLNNRWSAFERLIIWGSKHIFAANLILFFIACLIIVFVSTQYEMLKQVIPIPLTGLSPILEFQSAIFGAQVTILGLIFPLVIAFIGILLQGKSSNKTMWMVYRHNSGFMLVGFSALTLTAFFLISKVIEPWLSYQEIVAVALSVINWFFFNLYISGWFLWKTIQFLSLDERMEMVVKYAINDVIASDIRRRLLIHHCTAAYKTGLVPKSEEGKFEILTASLQDLPHHLTQNYSRPKSIANVWYRLLSLGVWLWTIKPRLLKSGDNIPVICLPFTVDGIKYKKLVLAKTKWHKINALSAFFIRQAVRVTSRNETAQLNLENMVGALFGQVEDALKENNSRQFEIAKENLEKFQKEIESSMFFINDNGEPDNWLLLPEGVWFHRSFLDVFIRETIGIAKTLTRRIHDDANYYETWCYLYPRLFGAKQTNRPRKVAEAYIDGHYYIWGQLMSGMGGNNSDDVSMAQQNDRVIKHFIGSWEHWPSLIGKNFESVLQANFNLALHHLANTSRMVIYAIKHGNWDASRWATDVLIHWNELFSNNNLSHHYHVWHHELITSQILKYDNEHRLRLAVSSPKNFIESEATSIALRNYWTDIRCLTAAYLMGSSKYRDVDDFIIYIDALLGCKRLESTGGIEINHAPISNTEDILGVYLRQCDCWGDRTYGSVLDQHIEQLARIEEPEWVSGRIYSSSGTRRGQYMPTFFKVVGIGLTRASFKLDNKWTNFLKSTAILQRELESSISRLQKLTSIDDSILDIVRYQFDIDNEEAERRRDLFIESMKDIITDLEAEIAVQIIAAPLDQKRLENFGVAASGSTFTLTDGPMPISLFQDIDYSDDFTSALVSTNVNDYAKSEVSEGLEVNRASNEDEWLNDIVKQQAAIVSFRQLFQKLPWKEKEFEEALALISHAVKDADLIKNMDLKPIMFIGPWSLYRLIDSSKWQYAREEDKLPFDIAVESDMAESYICHLAGIEIHRIPFGRLDFSVLLPLEAFKKIDVKRFGDDRYVDVTFKTEKATDLTGTLSLYFGIECKFQAKECFKYISLNPDDDKLS